MIYLHDTMAGEKRLFTPKDPTMVSVYQCGPTVYAEPHLGNGRPAVIFDVLNRLLRHTYGQGAVNFVRNYTDIDDKIIERARETHTSINILTDRTIHQYEKVMRSLGNLAPDRAPRATEHILDMVIMIEDLIAKGHAYEAEGHVLFSVASNPDHGKLSKQNLDGLRAGARVEVAPYKRDPADFVLWKPAKNFEPSWDSPWGMGRPGWHIECSAMIAHIFGVTIDIHVGGSDLIFPHHENEIAQSECAHNRPLAQYWLHNGMVTVDGQKMAKSRGNVVGLDDLTNNDAEAARYLLLTTHYRHSLDFTQARLAESRKALNSLYAALENGRAIAPGQVDDAVLEALRDDLNTPAAIAALHDLARRVNLGEETPDTLQKSAELLGLLHMMPESRRQVGMIGLNIRAIEMALADRERARANKDWAEADRIRDQLLRANVAIEDTPNGPVWRAHE